jgi:hypothetical protein
VEDLRVVQESLDLLPVQGPQSAKHGVLCLCAGSYHAGVWNGHARAGQPANGKGAGAVRTTAGSWLMCSGLTAGTSCAFGTSAASTFPTAACMLRAESRVSKKLNMHRARGTGSP